MILIWRFIYNFLVYPIIYFVVAISSLFSKKIRKAFLARHSQIKKLNNFKKTPGRRSILIHAASMGEFEHIKPVIGKIKETFPHSSIIVTFFHHLGTKMLKSLKVLTTFCIHLLIFHGF